MKLLGLAGIVSFIGVTHAQSLEQTCAANHPEIMNAIGKLVQISDLVVPSYFAENGMYADDLIGHVSISGNCDPPEWVPQEYIKSQFVEMCGNGWKKHKWGENSCQTWQIDYGHQAAYSSVSVL